MDYMAYFTILSRLAGSPQLYSHAPDAEEYKYVSSAINTALSMLEHEVSRHQLFDVNSILCAT